MIELGQLEGQWQEFEKRKVQVVVISIEDLAAAKATQAEFPHLTVVTDADRNLINVVNAIHPHSSPDGGDTAAPTTILIDRQGMVRWLFRPERHIVRLTPQELLAAVDERLSASR